MKNMTDRANPWSVPVVVAQIPDTGLHREIEADRATRDAMAVVAGLREILSAGLSLDPIENDIDEAIALIFAPPEQIPEMADLVDEAAESDADIPDPPEPIVN